MFGGNSHGKSTLSVNSLRIRTYRIMSSFIEQKLSKKDEMQKECVKKKKKKYTWSGTFRCVTVTKCQKKPWRHLLIMHSTLFGENQSSSAQTAHTNCQAQVTIWAVTKSTMNSSAYQSISESNGNLSSGLRLGRTMIPSKRMAEKPKNQGVAIAQSKHRPHLILKWWDLNRVMNKFSPQTSMNWSKLGMKSRPKTPPHKVIQKTINL